MDVQWEDPPPFARVIGSGHRPGKYAEFAAELRGNLRGWALLPDTDPPRTRASAAALGQSIRKNKVRGFEVGTFEAAVAGSHIWVRCVERGEDLDVIERPALSNDRVRTWAKRNGLSVSDRGRIPQGIVDGYLAEHPEERPVPPIRGLHPVKDQAGD